MTSDSQNNKSVKRRKDLLLDTRGACFLCLQEWLSDNGEEISANNNPDLNDKKRAILAQFSIRNICNYLKICPSSVLLTCLRDLGTEIEKDESSRKDLDFSVMLCDTCSSHAKKLTDLIVQAEVINMHLHYKLQEFNQILINSQRDELGTTNSRWNRVKEKMTSGDADPVEALLVEELRSIAKQEALAKDNKLRKDSHPKVLLEQLPFGSLNDIQNPPKSSDLHSDIKSLGESLLMEDDDSDYQVPEHVEEPAEDSNESWEPKAQTSMPPPTTKSSNSIASSEIQVTSKNGTPFSSQSSGVIDEKQLLEKDKVLDTFTQFYGILKSENRYECLVCKNYLSYEPHKMRYHLITQHLSNILKSSKLKSVSEEEFSHHCKELMRLGLDEGRKNAKAKIKIKVPSRVKFFTCVTCGQTRSNSNSYKFHLLVEHFSLCLEKLTCLQNNGVQPEVENQNRKKFMCRTMDGGCGEKFVTENGLRKHKLHTCPKIKPPKTYTCDLKDGGCGKAFFKKCILDNHKLIHCQNSIYRKSISYRSDKNKTFICDGCGQKFLTRRTLWKHQNLSCTILKPKIIGKCNPKNGGCGQIFSTRHAQLSHICPNRAKTQIWICAIANGGCGTIFNSRRAFNTHIKFKCRKRKLKDGQSNNKDEKRYLTGNLELEQGPDLVSNHEIKEPEDNGVDDADDGRVCKSEEDFLECSEVTIVKVET